MSNTLTERCRASSIFVKFSAGTLDSWLNQVLQVAVLDQSKPNCSVSESYTFVRLSSLFVLEQLELICESLLSLEQVRVAFYLGSTMSVAGQGKVDPAAIQLI